MRTLNPVQQFDPPALSLSLRDRLIEQEEHLPSCRWCRRASL
jgi:hypothetical protein